MKKVIATGKTKEQLDARLAQLLENTTFQVYQFARRGLLDRHKLILATQLVLQAANPNPNPDPNPNPNPNSSSPRSSCCRRSA